MQHIAPDEKVILTGRHKIRNFICLLLLLLAFLSGTAGLSASAGSSFSRAASAGSFEADFIDVGQGDASLISCDGHYMLIDGGTSDQSQKIHAILKRKSITHLDYIVCTHPHADHAGGLPGALAYASCGTALSSVADSDNSSFQEFRRSLDKKSVPLEISQEGDTYSLGSARITVLGPTDIDDSMDPNDMSLVLRIDYGKTSFLFPGDAEQDEQQLLLWNEEDKLRCTVLKAAHHGSSNGASYAFIAAVKPSITVISCGTGNAYGHPHEEALKLLKKEGSAVYRTDLQGDIVLRSDGKKVSAMVSRNKDADVFVPGSAAAEKASAERSCSARQNR